MPTAEMPYYRYHVFFCVNQREAGAACCQNHQAQAMREYAKARSKQLGLTPHGRVRINSAGCMNRCELGPVLVIYPEGVWYTYQQPADIDEILESHLLNGQIVERLLLK